MADPAPTRPCPACGAEWPDEIRYCGECGARMPDATVVASPYKVQVEATDLSRARPAPRAPHAPPPTTKERAAESAKNVAVVAPPMPVLVVPEPKTLAVVVKDVDLDVISEAWSLLRGRRALVAVGTFVLGLACAALCATGAGALLLGPVAGGWVVVALRATSGRKIELDNFFDGIRAWRRMLLVGVLVLACVLLGTMALVVPGIYLAMATMYAPFLVVDRGDAPWPALLASIDAVNVRLGRHVVLFLALGGLNLVASALPVLLLLTVPLTAVAAALAYGRVFGVHGGAEKLRVRHGS